MYIYSYIRYTTALGMPRVCFDSIDKDFEQNSNYFIRCNIFHNRIYLNWYKLNAS
jgi:hypothetical protein